MLKRGAANPPQKGRVTMEDVYVLNGYDNRKDYLEQLADEYDCPIETVYALADVLGQDEDFDGLVSAMRDYEEMRDYE